MSFRRRKYLEAKVSGANHKRKFDYNKRRNQDAYWQGLDEALA